MKFAHIQAMELAETQRGWLHGEIVYKFGEYEKAVPISVLMKPDGTYDWSMDAPGFLPMQVDTIGGCQVYYEHPVSVDEAGKLAGWLLAEGHIGEEPGSMFIRKSGSAYVFCLAVVDGTWPNAAMEAFAEDFARRLPNDIFGGAAVEVHLTDQKLRTLKVISER